VTVDFQIKHINVSKAFEKNRLSFHHWVAGKGANPQSVVPLLTTATRFPRGVLESVVLTFLDLQAGVCDSWRVGQVQIRLSPRWLARSHLHLPMPFAEVVIESLVFCHGQCEPSVGKALDLW